MFQGLTSKLGCARGVVFRFFYLVNCIPRNDSNDLKTIQTLVILNTRCLTKSNLHINHIKQYLLSKWTEVLRLLLCLPKIAHGMFTVTIFSFVLYLFHFFIFNKAFSDCFIKTILNRFDRSLTFASICCQSLFWWCKMHVQRKELSVRGHIW